MADANRGDNDRRREVAKGAAAGERQAQASATDIEINSMRNVETEWNLDIWSVVTRSASFKHDGIRNDWPRELLGVACSETRLPLTTSGEGRHRRSLPCSVHRPRVRIASDDGKGAFSLGRGLQRSGFMRAARVVASFAF